MNIEKNRTAEKFKDYLIFQRKKLGLTQKELAQRAFESDNGRILISNIERGKAGDIRLSSIDAILRGLESDIDFYQPNPVNNENN